MNKNILEGDWNQLKGQVKSKWGKLTEDDLTEIKGNMQVLSGKIQERYGYDQQRIEKELTEFQKKHASGH